MRTPARIAALVSALAVVAVLGAQRAGAADHSVSWSDPSPDSTGLLVAPAPDDATIDIVKTTIAEVGTNMRFIVQVRKLGYTTISLGWFSSVVFSDGPTEFAVTAERGPYGDTCYVSIVTAIPPAPLPTLFFATPTDPAFKCAVKFDPKTNTTSVTIPLANLSADLKGRGLRSGPGTRLTSLESWAGHQFVPTAYGFSDIDDDDPAPHGLSFTLT